MELGFLPVCLLVACAVAALVGALGTTPTQMIFERAVILLGTDTATFNPASDPPRVILINQPFTEGLGLTIADLTEADFDGYSGVEIQNPALESIDPLTGQAVLNITAGASPFLWETTGTTNLPQTIYGYAVVKNDGTVLYSATRFTAAQEVTLTGVNQSVGPVSPQLRYSPSGVS